MSLAAGSSSFTKGTRAHSTGKWVDKNRIQAYAFQTGYHQDAPRMRQLKRAALLKVLRRTNPHIEKSYLHGVLARASYANAVPEGSATSEWIAAVQHEVKSFESNL